MAITNQEYSSGDKLLDRVEIENSRTAFNVDGKYQVTNLMYPTDLLSATSSTKYPTEGGTEYGGNYVIFYINVNENSKLLRDKNNTVIDDWTESDKTRLAGSGITRANADTAMAVQGGVAGGLLKGDFEGAAFGAAVGVAATEVVGMNNANFTRQMKRLAAAIALHTPNQHSARYSANWEETSTSAFQMAAKGGEGLVRAVMEGAKKQAISNETKDLAAGIGGALALSAPGMEAVSAVTGLAANPKKEQLFKGVDFRTWTFEYQFFPRSQQEMENVQNIIYLFKLHMHPEYKDANNFLYIYPSEFDIIHYNGINENLNLPRHTSCVLTELVVNYTPQSQFNSFEYGAPTQINIQMTFKELSQMSKERIKEGF